MSARYKFYFDNTEVNDPLNWDTLATGIKRDETSRGLLVTQDATLEFSGNEYTYLYNKLLDDGFCSFTEVEIHESCNMNGNYVPVYKGVIFTSDCEFNINDCRVTTKIQDNSFYAKINGRKNNECYINVGRSINDVAITACSPVTITMFYPCSPASEADRYGYRMFDVMQFLVAFMTDGEVEFASPVLDDGGDFEGLCIASGKQIRVFGEQDHISKFSFSKAFENLWKKLNLGFYVDYSGSKPTLVLDYNDNMFSDTVVLTLDDVPNIKARVDVSKIYSAVTLGTNKTRDNETNVDCADGAFVEQISFLGCKEETFNIIGKCNIDRTLDLVTDWIVSSNLIQYIYIDASPGGSDDDTYDDDIIFIDCEKTGATTYAAYKTNNLGGDVTVTAFFNVRLFNDSVALRFLGAIPLSIAEYLGDGDDTFSAVKTTAQNATFASPADPVAFTSETSDPNGNYDNGNSWFIAPFAGLYTMHVNLQLNAIFNSILVSFSVYFDVYDNANVFLYSVLTFTTSTPNSNNVVDSSSVLYANATDRIRVRFVADSLATWQIKSGSTYSCIASTTGGGIYQTYNPEDYPIINYSFSFPLSNEEKSILKNQPYGMIQINSRGKTYYAWCQDIKVNDTTGLTDFKLITKQNAGN